MTKDELMDRVKCLPITNSNHLVDWHVIVDGEVIFVSSDYYDAVARRDFERRRLEEEAVKKAEYEAKHNKKRRLGLK